MIGLATILGWTPQDVRGLSDAELAAAVSAAEYQTGWPPSEDLLAAIFEQLNAIYLLMAKRWSRKGARLPKPVTVPRPYKAAGRAQPTLDPNRKVMSPMEAAFAMKRGEV